MKRKKTYIQIFGLVALFLVAACGGGDEGSTLTSEKGSLSVDLTDATTTDYKAVYITVKEVKVSQAAEDEEGEIDDDSWIVVATPNKTYNLLELVNGVVEHLGLTDLEAGRYNQIRLVLSTEPDESLNIKDEAHPFANYIIYGDNSDYHELLVPSCYQSGLKIVSGFTIEADQQTDLVLDFNVLKSIIQAGASGQWLLKPTVKALDQDASSSISGIVYYLDGGDMIPVEGAIVSAQITTDTDETEIVSATTVTDETGGYRLLVEAGTYTLVVITEGYQTTTAEVVAAAGDMTEQDFQLAPVDGTGTIFGSVNILNGDGEQSVTINILETQDDGTTAQVSSVSVANGGTYWFDLPIGTYSMVAIFLDDGQEMTLKANESFEISDGTVIEFDILFEDTAEENADGDDQLPEKVTICHKGREITISSSALQAHLNHGDTEGSCDDEESDGAIDDDPDQKITICHKGRQITVSASALDAHLKHGDTIGACGGDTQSSDGGDDGFSGDDADDTDLPTEG